MPSAPMPASLHSQIEAFLYKVTELNRAIALPIFPVSSVNPEILKTIEPPSIGSKTDLKTIYQQITQLQQQFQAILAAFSAAERSPSPAIEPEIDPVRAQRLRPFQTEAHRRLRLLAIEAMRLQAAQQTATLERGLQQLQIHLSALQKFAQAMADDLSF